MRIGIRSTDGLLFFADVISGLDIEHRKHAQEQSERKRKAAEAAAKRKRPLSSRR